MTANFFAASVQPFDVAKKTKKDDSTGQMTPAGFVSTVFEKVEAPDYVVVAARC